MGKFSTTGSVVEGETNGDKGATTMKRMRCGVTIGLISGLLFSCCVPRPKPKDIPDFVWKPLVNTFEQQARGIPKDQWETLWTKYLANPKIPVRVAVVDAVPDEHAAPMRSSHKEAVSGVIRTLLCPDSDATGCGARVAVTPGNSSGQGHGTGHADGFLTFRELYDSLTAILAQWRPEQEHLVVNFAVGWDPIKTASNKTPLNDPNAAPILQLLQRASCKGAILIAPAGNLTGSVGPLFPAGYEALRAPTAQECARSGYPRRTEIAEDHAPLVYAVGALDQFDDRMVTVRPWGLPRLAAYGLSITSPRPGVPRDTFSGTSMSAAIVSGVAAAVWTAQPELSAERVMEIVYDGGIPVDAAHRDDQYSRTYPGYYYSTHTQTDFCLGHQFGPCTDAVHRVFLCGALAKVLPQDAALRCVQEPSTADDQPPLPRDKVPRELPEALPCTTSGCGHSLGPTADQVPNGAVPQPGISGCLGCALYLVSQLGHFSLKWDSFYKPSMMSAIVQTWNSNATNPTKEMGTWDLANDVWMNMVDLPSDTWGAVLTVTYFDWDDGRVKTQDIGLRIYKTQ
jgi:hypothetical protein